MLRMFGATFFLSLGVVVGLWLSAQGMVPSHVTESLRESVPPRTVPVDDDADLAESTRPWIAQDESRAASSGSSPSYETARSTRVRVKGVQSPQRGSVPRPDDGEEVDSGGESSVRVDVTRTARKQVTPLVPTSSEVEVTWEELMNAWNTSEGTESGVTTASAKSFASEGTEPIYGHGYEELPPPPQ